MILQGWEPLVLCRGSQPWYWRATIPAEFCSNFNPSHLNHLRITWRFKGRLLWSRVGTELFRKEAKGLLSRSRFGYPSLVYLPPTQGCPTVLLEGPALIKHLNQLIEAFRIVRKVQVGVLEHVWAKLCTKVVLQEQDWTFLLYPHWTGLSDWYPRTNLNLSLTHPNYQILKGNYTHTT